MNAKRVSTRAARKPRTVTPDKLVGIPARLKPLFQRIDAARVAKGLHKGEMLKRAGLSGDLYREAKRKGSEPRRDTIERLAAVLDVSAGFLAYDQPTDEHIESAAILPPERDDNTLEVVGYVHAGGAVDRYPVGTSLDRVPKPEGATDRTAAVEIRGKSLGAQFDRWIVYYDDVRRPLTSDLIGQLCIVGLADDRVLIKQIARGKNGFFNLISNNPEEPIIENVEIVWAALVNEIRRKR